jgi:MFS-type transporter involved in bile tolerance (Atg22 family)
MTKRAYILIAIIAVIVIVQIVGFLMSNTGYFFSPTIDVVLGGLELFGLGIWLGIFIGKKRS